MSHDLTTVPVFGAEQTARLLPYAELADALHACHRRPPAETRRVVYGPPGTDDSFLALPAWEPGVALGIKLVTVFPDNPARRVPAVQAVFVMFDGSTGSPVALVDGTELTYRKTAASSALASRFLSRTDATTLLMVGAGALAPHLIAAHRAVRPSIERVLVWNRTRAKAAELAELAGATVVDDLDEAVGEADIVSTATMANQPLIAGARLSPGTHLDCVGAYLPHLREVDDDCVRRARIYLDSPAALDEPGDLVAPLAAGVIHRDDIVGDLFDLCTGRVEGRTDDTEITLFESLGGGHLDLMTAQALHARHLAEGAAR